MIPWKLPPKAKVYEAFSVLADKRYEITGEGTAKVISSSGDKEYTVKWKFHDPSVIITSNDNASKWQGYTGYPIIALLMVTGKLQFDTSIIEYFKLVPWNSINKAFKNNYELAVQKVLKDLGNDDAVSRILMVVDSIYQQLQELQVVKP